MDLKRLGISGMTTKNWSLEEDMKGLVANGISNIGLWLFKCGQHSPQAVRQLMLENNLHVSNVCFGGVFTGEDEEARRSAIEETKKAIDFTKEVQGDCLLLISGPLGNHSFDKAVEYVRRGLLEVCDYAEKRQVHLALEPIHPMYVTDFSIIHTLDFALQLVNEIGSAQLGLFLDTFNIGWDPSIQHVIPKCKGKIKGVHLADWRNPTRSLSDRALPGQGVFPVREIIGKIEQAGYTGPYDLEIFSDELWASDYNRMLIEIKEWFAAVEVEEMI
ncbi:sugar phosphate isomerase/epimerase family protein [Paenibacillus beijingensis]|uniref:Xylose isomerase-like TIM barrel domain-containing protein n=1 Tax=Paenibacillus beijingensis TaxID=1126833 RepID=A0A0D5NGB3_9BACL|nr:sugar phosphate isomerase/epimerase family protein [Paenibacillus beijingensis]AJY74150.1 hypothetical protein VN24_05620 [Paenibacillus beijingensis]